MHDCEKTGEPAAICKHFVSIACESQNAESEPPRDQATRPRIEPHILLENFLKRVHNAHFAKNFLYSVAAGLKPVRIRAYRMAMVPGASETKCTSRSRRVQEKLEVGVCLHCGR